MRKRTLVLAPQHLFPTDEWRIVEARHSEAYYEQCETVFALSNGYVGVRGTFDEGRPVQEPGVFVNGFHEEWPILHAEEAYGLARTGQTIVNVPDATVFRLYVDDEPLFVATARMKQYARILDMRAGTLTRELVWETPAGKTVMVRSCRIVSLEHRHLMAVIYEVMLPEHSAPVAISSLFLNRQDVHLRDEPGRRRALDPRRGTTLPNRVLNAQVIEKDGSRMLLGYQTTNSRMTLAVGVDHVIESPPDCDLRVSLDADVGEAVLTADAKPGVPIRIIKYITYQSSRSTPSAEFVARAGRTLDRARRDGPDALLASQRSELDAVLGPGRCRGHLARGPGMDRAHPPGGSLEPLSGLPGELAGPRVGHPRQGPHLAGVRGALLLGYRGLPAAVPRLHAAADRPQSAALPP